MNGDLTIGAYGSPMNLPIKVQEGLLQTSLLSGVKGKHRWAFLDGIPYSFQPSAGTWHGYAAFDRIIGWNMQIPQDILNVWKKEKLVTNAQYKKLINKNVHITDMK